MSSAAPAAVDLIPLLGGGVPPPMASVALSGHGNRPRHGGNDPSAQHNVSSASATGARGLQHIDAEAGAAVLIDENDIGIVADRQHALRSGETPRCRSQSRPAAPNSTDHRAHRPRGSAAWPQRRHAACPDIVPPALPCMAHDPTTISMTRRPALPQFNQVSCSGSGIDLPVRPNWSGAGGVSDIATASRPLRPSQRAAATQRPACALPRWAT